MCNSVINLKPAQFPSKQYDITINQVKTGNLNKTDYYRRVFKVILDLAFKKPMDQMSSYLNSSKPLK